MHRGRVSRSVCLLLGLSAALAAVPAVARFAGGWREVPLPRLLENVGRYAAAQPKDASAQYLLGRLHSLGFSQEAEEVLVTPPPDRIEKAEQLPRFPPFSSLQVQPPQSPTPAALRHLEASLRHYHRATELEPKAGLHWMSLGWMLEHGAAFADKARIPYLPADQPTSPALWREKALDAYRKAYALTVETDLREGSIGPRADSVISLEAGEGIIRVLADRKLTDAQKRELEKVKKTVAELKSRPRVVTPILIGAEPGGSLDQLLAAERTTRFDLAGDGSSRRWPWVRPDTAILVWDPEGSGRIESGRQLFGSFTWSMFWKDGYEPLAALDDDADGQLSGPELRGLAVWRDRNGNGRSDRGEVRPLADEGIVVLAVRAAGTTLRGEPANPRGARRADGTWLPTFDWLPTSLPDGRPR
ncbi:MAG: hypothetical protein ACK47B_18480 [Armatimonadota bacterium]